MHDYRREYHCSWFKDKDDKLMVHISQLKCSHQVLDLQCGCYQWLGCQALYGQH